MCKTVKFEKLNKCFIILFTEMNGSSIMLYTANFTSWRMYHILDETPTEVTFLGQRESYFIHIEIFSKNPIYLCEIEVAGRLSIFSCNTIKHNKKNGFFRQGMYYCIFSSISVNNNSSYIK